jgi:DNA-binding MarR family transcriptional regulator
MAKDKRKANKARFGIEAAITRKNAPPNFLKLFYPYHYSVGNAVEKHLSGGVLDRHETVILWLIHSKGEGGATLPRKVIERLIGEWYELSSPAISKALRRMAKSPRRLVDIGESETSGRERTVTLTPEGRALVQQMITNAAGFIRRIVDHLSDEQIHAGMDFMARVSEIVEDELGEKN